MIELIYNLPEQMKDALRIAQACPLPRLRPPANIVITGMGGSGISANLLQSLLLNVSPVNIVAVKDYALPASVRRDSLFFAISYSGRTEETARLYEQAIRLHCPRIVITSATPQAGRHDNLADRAAALGDTIIRVPSGFPPRAAIAYLFIPLLITLCRFRLIPDFRNQLNETIRLLIQTRNRLRLRARALARELKDRVPVIYAASPLFAPVAYRWQCQCNENAKVFAHHQVLPELCHNEIVGMGGPAAFRRLAYLLVLNDPNADDRVNLRVELTLDILRNQCADSRIITPDGKSNLARMFSLLMFGDLVSYFLAAQYKVDPMPVKRIDELKKRLASAH